MNAASSLLHYLHQVKGFTTMSGGVLCLRLLTLFTEI